MAALQAPNQLLDVLRALRRRRYQVAVPALLVSTFGIAFAVIVPKRFKVSTRVEISDRTRIESDFRLRNAQETAVRREAPAAFDHIVHFARVKEVLDRNMALWPEYVQARNDNERAQYIRRNFLSGDLSAGPTTKEPKGGTIFVDISYSDEDPQRAARFLTDLASSWLVDVFESDKKTLSNEKDALQSILDAQTGDLRTKEDRLSKLMQLLGQDPSLTDTDGRREEPGNWTFRALDKAKTELSDLEEGLSTARFELDQVRARHEAEPAMRSRLVTTPATDPTVAIERLRGERAEREAEIAKLRPSHSRYRELREKIEAIDREIQELEGKEPEDTGTWVDEENPLKAEYALALQKKEDEVDRLEEQRRLAVARIDALEEETKALTQHYKSLEDLRNQVSEARTSVNETQRQWQERDKSLQMLTNSPTPWRIAQPPVPSSAAVQPNPYIVGAAAVFLGLALGIGLAVLSEFARSSYRSVSDLATVMSVPVLGAIETIITRRERRALQVSRAIGGLSTAVIVGSVGWVTWLWSSAPERLPLEVQDVIEHLRSALK